MCGEPQRPPQLESSTLDHAVHAAQEHRPLSAQGNTSPHAPSCKVPDSEKYGYREDGSTRPEGPRSSMQRNSRTDADGPWLSLRKERARCVDDVPEVPHADVRQSPFLAKLRWPRQLEAAPTWTPIFPGTRVSLTRNLDKPHSFVNGMMATVRRMRRGPVWHLEIPPAFGRYLAHQAQAREHLGLRLRSRHADQPPRHLQVSYERSVVDLARVPQLLHIGPAQCSFTAAYRAIMETHTCKHAEMQDYA